jgi:putative membrane protein
MMLRTFFAICAVVGLVTTAQAQSAAVSGKDFAAAVASSDKFEVKSSKMALKISSNKDIKSFAQQMIDDHKKSTIALRSAAKEAKIELPKGLNDKHKALVTSLQGKKGVEFDRAYIEEQTKAHEEAVAMFSTYAQSGDQPKLKAFAAEMLPTLKLHQEHVKKLTPAGT